MIDIVFPEQFIESSPTQRVYIKKRWGDSWQYNKHLWCLEAHWTSGRSLPSAKLRYRYGKRFESEGGEIDFTALGPNRQLLSYYVKVEYDCADGGMQIWYGRFDIQMDDIQGVLSSGEPTGVLNFLASGLEIILQDQVLFDAWCSDGQGNAYKVERSINFNHEGLPNRSPVSDADGIALHLGRPDSLAKFWSSRDIVRYLLKRHRPLDSAGNPTIEISLRDTGYIPDWDRPELTTKGVSLFSLLNSVIPRERMLGWRLDVIDENLVIQPFSFSHVSLPIAGVGGAAIRENADPFTLDVRNDRSAKLGDKRTRLDSVDRVRARGAKRTSTGTFSKYQSSLAAGWSGDLKDEYNLGGSLDAGYPPATESDKRKLYNYQSRARERLAAVFSRFVLDPAWNGKVGNGYIGAANRVLMPDSNGLASALAAEEFGFLPRTRFLKNYSYVGSLAQPEKLSDGKQEYSEPMVLFRRKDWFLVDVRYRQAEGMDVTGELPEEIDDDDFVAFDVEVRDKALWLKSKGGFQHWLAKSDFVPLDTDEPNIPLDWQDMLVTATVEWSAYCEGVWPSEPEPTDAVREIVLDLGEKYRADFVAQDTVLGIDKGGRPQLATNAGFIQDDRAYCSGVAQSAYLYYSKTRSTVSFSTAYLSSELKIGHMLHTLKEHVDLQSLSVVTSIHIASPLSDSEKPQLARMGLETDHGELDAVTFASSYRAHKQKSFSGQPRVPVLKATK
jgi:hypothetical protein